jgi:hypothetical protein
MGLGLGMWMGLGQRSAPSGGGGGSTFRYFKLTTTATEAGTAVAVAEFGPALTLGGVNAATAATASATSTNGGNVPANVLDGNDTTIWASSGAPPQDLELDLGATSSNWIDPAEFIITAWSSTSTFSPQDFVIYGSVDHSSWTALVTRTSEPHWTSSEVRRYTSA